MKATIEIMNVSSSILNIELSQKLTFYFLIILIFPSFILSCFVLYQIIRRKQIRNRLNNHLIICIFFIYFLQTISDLPLTMTFLYHNQVAVTSDTFCKCWFTIAVSYNIASVQLNGFLSVERYFLIFHQQFLQKYKIVVHYVPMIILLFSPILIVSILVNYYPCDNHFIYNAWACGSACYVIQPVMNIAIWVYSILAPTAIMIISTMSLILRVIHQRKRMVQRNIWKQNTKMIIQLLFVTGMVYASWLPITITSILNMIYSNEILYELQARWILIGLIYIDVLFSPLALLMAIPELKQELILWIDRWKQQLRHHRNRILPVTSARTQPNQN